MTKDEALKLALEALEPFITPNWAGAGVDKANKAYAAINEALAQDEQDAGYVCVDGYRHPAAFIYTTPPKAQPEQEPRWYCIDKNGMATLCADEDDAKQNANLAAQDWPRNAPYRAVQLCEYAPPQRPWVGLTDEECIEIMRYEKDFWGVSGWEWECMKSIAAKLKEKNFD